MVSQLLEGWKSQRPTRTQSSHWVAVASIMSSFFPVAIMTDPRCWSVSEEGVDAKASPLGGVWLGQPNCRERKKNTNGQQFLPLVSVIDQKIIG